MQIVSTRGARLASLCFSTFALATATATAQQQRPMPDTTYGIHVFNDGLSAGLNPELVQFSAQHYAGTQKMTRSDADHLRAVNPDFLILHYRLGMGLGYRQITSPCNPSGGWFSVINGTWEQEWPGDANVQEPWFYHWNNQRVLQCQWGWYLTDVANAAWRTWWSDRVLQQLANNDDDGLFADSFMVPNYMGGFSPALPAVDATFEATWTAKLESMMTYMRSRFAGRYFLIPNIGSWVTSRDQTDFSLADGVFIEGFGYDVWESYGLEGWTIQNDRLIGLINDRKIVIGQSYSNYSPNERLFTLATHLLIKGEHTFVNLEEGQAPEWFPEYTIPIGAPLAGLPANTDGLYDAAKGVYVRDYTNGRVLVNPSDSATHTINLGAMWYLAQPTGGGTVPSNGVLPATWRVDYAPVTQVTLQPGRAALLLVDPSPYTLESGVLYAGTPASITAHGATAGGREFFFLNHSGPGQAAYPSLGVTLGLLRPRLGAIRIADANGDTTWRPTFPAGAIGMDFWFQAAEAGHTTNVLQARIH